MHGRAFDLVQRVAGRDQHFLWRAAAVRTGAAEQTLFDHRHRHPGAPDRPGYADAGIAAAQDDHIELFPAHRTIPSSWQWSRCIQAALAAQPDAHTWTGWAVLLRG